MEGPPRRAILGGLGSTITIAAAGCLSSATDESAPSSESDESGSGTEPLEYLPPSAGSDSPFLAVTDLEALPDDELSPPVARYPPTVLSEEADPTKTITAGGRPPDEDEPIGIVAGDSELDSAVTDDLDSRETDGLEYEFAETNDYVVGVVEETVLIAESESVIEDAVSTAATDSKSLLETRSDLADALETFPDTDVQHAFLVDEEGIGDVDPSSIRFGTYASTYVDDEVRKERYGIEFTDRSVVTDEFVDELLADLAIGAVDPDVETDGPLVTVTWMHDLEAEREAREHDSPRFSSPRGIDLDEAYLELTVSRGDPTPLEELTLELGDESYDESIWADGRETIQKGDTLLIAMDDVEPNLSVRLRHETTYGSSSAGTTILGNFAFEFEYDRETHSVTVSYADDREYPLEGGKIHLSVVEDHHYGRTVTDEPTVTHSSQPWDGVLEVGDDATIEDVQIGDYVLVGWDGDEPADSIAGQTIRPPERIDFDYQYESETLTVEFYEPESGADVAADSYEVRIDDELADTQWDDEYETLSDGATLTVENVELGSQATVCWSETDFEIASTRARPRIDLSASLENESLEVTHEGGPSLPVSEIHARIFVDGHPTDDPRPLGAQLDDKFTEGDSVSFEISDVDRHVIAHLEYSDEFDVGSARDST